MKLWIKFQSFKGIKWCIMMAIYNQASFKIDVELHSKLKIKAVEENRPQWKIIEQALIEYLDKEQTKLDIKWLWLKNIIKIESVRVNEIVDLSQSQ